MIDIHILVNWQLSKQGISWPVSQGGIADSGDKKIQNQSFCQSSASSAKAWILDFTFFKQQV